MTIKSLEQTPFNVLMECFLAAFENYYVKMPVDYQFYEARWRRAKVSFSDSYGMFDGDKLVGFMIHAVDERNGNRIAFNTGTGVLPEYRGQRIVQQLYDHCIPILKKKGITMLALEVITENERAVKAYSKVGFSITKRYQCYSGAFQVQNNQANYELRKIAQNDLDWNVLNQSHYSWDNHIKTLKNGDYDYFVVSKRTKDVAYFVIDSHNGYVAQFDVFENITENWDALFNAIGSVSETIRINNVDERLISKTHYLEKIKLKNTVDQFEMEMSI
ncbi:MAG: GNAT family N-acetyltransferase [Flavobacteriaceae bacterium]|nr:GNAT family N-acetyltransferase [Flavobacteriaceae bacterium]